MIQRFKANLHLRYFILHSFTYIFIGCFIAAPGPVIPFLSSKHHIPQTQFTFFFTYRSIGLTVGAILTQFIVSKIKIHTTFIISTISFGIPFVLFPFTNSIGIQGFYIFLSSILCASLGIVLAISIIQMNKGNHEEFWLMLGHAMFGIGGLIGPIFIAFWGQYGFPIIGLGMILASIGYFYLESPNVHHEQDKKQGQFQPIKKKSVYILMFMLLVYFGEETGFSGWISSYVVMLNLDTKEGATKFPSIFWVFLTIFRFALAGMPGKVSYKLILLTKIQIVSYIISIILTMLGYSLFAVYWNSILAGIAYSSMYALMYTLCIEFRQSITPSQTASIMMFPNLGEGFACAIIGYTMQLFHPIALFYSLVITGIIMLGLISLFMKDLSRNEPNKNEVQLNEKLYDG